MKQHEVIVLVNQPTRAFIATTQHVDTEHECIHLADIIIVHCVVFSQVCRVRWCVRAVRVCAELRNPRSCKDHVSSHHLGSWCSCMMQRCNHTSTSSVTSHHLVNMLVTTTPLGHGTELTMMQRHKHVVVHHESRQHR